MDTQQDLTQNLADLPSQKRERRVRAVGYSLGVMFTLALAAAPYLPINQPSKIKYGIGLITVALLTFFLIWGEYWHQQRETEIQTGFSTNMVLQCLRQSGSSHAVATANEFEYVTSEFHTCCMRLNLAGFVLLCITVLPWCLIRSPNPTVHSILNTAFWATFGIQAALRGTSERLHRLRKQLRCEALELCYQHESASAVVTSDTMFHNP